MAVNHVTLSLVLVHDKLSLFLAVDAASGGTYIPPAIAPESPGKKHFSRFELYTMTPISMKSQGKLSQNLPVNC